MDKLRLRQIIGIVLKNNIVEFFNANTRSTVVLKIDFPEIIEFLHFFDGTKLTEEIIAIFPQYPRDDLIKLVHYLYGQYILIREDRVYSEYMMENHYRLINTLEDFCHSTTEVVDKINKINNSKVMIIGLGSVGSYIAVYLAKLGVSNFILVDNDVVDLSNLHRQYYFEDQIGMLKTEALSQELKSISNKINVQKINENLSNDLFVQYSESVSVDLIINCADEPSVDYTSELVATFAMKHKIPHIIGGGYNLHLTLIGQTIIPFETACFNCFKSKLDEINTPELVNVKKLHRENRKVGSFPPLSGISATLSVLDAFKVLINKYDTLNHSNKRIEFLPRTKDLNIINIPKNNDCQWCNRNEYVL
ncbi:ThiF family adenylyltransferase [Wohlfahrtiimonas chitiniclastica]|uniref:HesA/MoeB/ThiF family protein n=1 Tax=Wohlfahrtiimonas chitiniclastica TaxID=400946 RepID=UPI001BCFAA16|nr:ThiF family adenylyltransferase [Wohlfahrtiimonas chitiniclastica]